jgi:retron-type reverse transcriptase
MILEKIVAKQLVSFLDKHNIINYSQFGFRKNKSTNDAIAFMVDKIIEYLDNKLCANCVFSDLSKAFDCIDHEVLLDKPYQYGIRGVPHKLIESYLTNRTQIVQIDYKVDQFWKNYQSSSLPVKYGVPQGSVLGPLLFIIYMNDVPKLTGGMSFMYADDTSILNVGENLAELEKATCDNTNKVTILKLIIYLQTSVRQTLYCFK